MDAEGAEETPVEVEVDVKVEVEVEVDVDVEGSPPKPREAVSVVNAEGTNRSTRRRCMSEIALEILNCCCL